jgi:hypothetical protein
VKPQPPTVQSYASGDSVVSFRGENMPPDWVGKGHCVAIGVGSASCRIRRIGHATRLPISQGTAQRLAYFHSSNRASMAGSTGKDCHFFKGNRAHVEWFGAIPNDPSDEAGIANSAALSRAIGQCLAAGVRELHMTPTATYNLATPVVVPVGLTLVAEGVERIVGPCEVLVRGPYTYCEPRSAYVDESSNTVYIDCARTSTRGGGAAATDTGTALHVPTTTGKKARDMHWPISDDALANQARRRLEAYQAARQSLIVRGYRAVESYTLSDDLTEDQGIDRVEFTKIERL